VHRIAVVIDPWDYPFNGTVVSTRRFIRALSESAFEFQLLSLPGPGIRGDDAFEQLSIPGVNGIINAMKAPLARIDRSRIRRLLEGCDLLHVQYPFFLAYAAIEEAKRMGIPVVCSFHVQPENILENLRLANPLLSKLLYRIFIHFIYGRADHVVAPSPFAASLLEAHGLDRPVTVISNGIPGRFFEVERRQTSGNRKRLLSVGRLAREKQQETLLRAVALSRHRESLQIVMAGVGPRERYLGRLADRLGVDARIGWVDDDELLGLYGEADLFLHAGAIELEGMSVLEAMAAGNTVIVSDSADSACANIVHDANARFPMGAPAELARRSDYWLDHPEQSAIEGGRNRQFAETLRHDRAAGTLKAFYEDVLVAAARDSAAKPRLTGTS